mmetsp:Transcript_31174/g.59263  ORF Transcript_31174/g.59263 Transcript_31174/m.59263 type:complete len:80 (-) Transcript_31174:272-511(-)
MLHPATIRCRQWGLHFRHDPIEIFSSKEFCQRPTYTPLDGVGHCKMTLDEKNSMESWRVLRSIFIGKSQSFCYPRFPDQ